MNTQQPDGAKRGLDVLHVVGTPTPVVLSYLVPAANALNHAGLRQKVLFVSSHAASRPARLHGNVDVWIEVCASRLRGWQAGLKQLSTELADQKVNSVHFHGFVPLILGTLLLRRAGFSGHIFYSPHGSKAHSRFAWLGGLLYAVLSPIVGGSRLIVLADDLGDTDNRFPVRKDAMNFVPLSVHRDYLAIEHLEAPVPVVVGGSTERSGQDLNAFCQLSVMVPSLFESARGAEFFWIGPTSDGDADQLRAAGVSLVSPHDVVRKREVLSVAWVFIAPNLSRGFPVLAAEAMASGVTVLAPDRADYQRLLLASRCGLTFANFNDALRQLHIALSDPQVRAEASSTGRSFFALNRSEQQFESEVMNYFGASKPMEDRSLSKSDVVKQP